MNENWDRLHSITRAAWEIAQHKGSGAFAAIVDRFPTRAGQERLAAKANDNQPGGRDTIGHSGVQPWSAGEVFPAVIYRVEDYDSLVTLHTVKRGKITDTGEQRPLSHRLRNKSWSVTLDGRTEDGFASYDDDDARTVAAALVADPALRRRWQDVEV